MRRMVTALHGILFCLLLTGIGVINFIYLDRSELSTEENRRLADSPEIDAETLGSGRFAEDFDAFLNDRFFIRKPLLVLGQRLAQWKGLPSDTELVRVRGGDLFLAQEDPKADLAAAAERQISRPAVRPIDVALLDPGGGLPPVRANGAPLSLQAALADADGAIQPARMVNEVLLVGNQGFEILGYAEASGKYYTDAIKLFAEGIPDEVPVYTMVVPSHLSHLDPEVYGGPFGADQQAAIQSMYENLAPRVRGVDVSRNLREHRFEYIYFRTDHHWTARGAYQAYRALASAAGIAPVSLSLYGQDEVGDFLGSFHLLTQSPRLSGSPDVLELFVPYLDYEYLVQRHGKLEPRSVIDKGFADDQNKYQIFISGDRPHGIIRTPEAPARRLMVFKDSYGNALIPFLMPHFEEIHIIDPRYFEQNVHQYFEDNEITDVLFVCYFAVVASARGYARNVYRVMNLPRTSAPLGQTAAPTIEPSASSGG